MTEVGLKNTRLEGQGRVQDQSPGIEGKQIHSPASFVHGNELLFVRRLTSFYFLDLFQLILTDSPR